MQSAIQIPLPTFFKDYDPNDKRQGVTEAPSNVNRKYSAEDYIYNSQDGWIKKSDNACTILYNLAKPHLKTNDIAIDIGCRYGEFTSACANDFESIYCFDPLPYKSFGFNSQINKYRGKIKHFSCALGDKPEFITMYMGCHENSCLEGRARRFKKRTKHVALSIPLDFFAFKNKSISLIKIDVEGFELRALKGASKIISCHHPLIIIEKNGNHMLNENPNSALNYLRKMNYDVVTKSKDKDGNLMDLVLSYRA